MTIRAHDQPDRIDIDPPYDREDWSESEIERLASDLELRMTDNEWLDLLIDGADTWLWPIGRKGADGKPCQTDMDRIRAERLRALRNAVLAHRYEDIGRIMVDAFRSALIAKTEAEL